MKGDTSKLLGIFGVMDGHGGDFSSAYVASFLPSAIEEAFNLVIHDNHADFIVAKESIEESLFRAFAATESSLQHQPRMKVEVEKIVKENAPIKWKVTPVLDNVSHNYILNIDIHNIHRVGRRQSYAVSVPPSSR